MSNSMSSTDNNNNFILQHSLSYRQAFYSSNRTPFLLPQGLIPSFFIPLLYLSIPHKKNPWLYYSRYPITFLITYLNYHMLKTVSSLNEAIGYAVGLMASWGTIWIWCWLIFYDAQKECKRVVRVLKKPRNRKKEKEENPLEEQKPIDESNHPEKYEYIWESYPFTSNWFHRLEWSTSLLLNFRGIGWNWSPQNIFPSFVYNPQETVVNLATIPLKTKPGYTRSLTYTSFLRSRLTIIILSYLYLDLWTIIFRQDPYFIYGPTTHTQPLSPFLAWLPHPLLSGIQSLAALTGIASALLLYTNTYQLLSISLLRGTSSELWQYPPVFGSFNNILRKGLRGFWGAYWHQTFRVGFTAPIKPLSIKKREIKMLAEMLVAFFLSGIIHACGGTTSAFRESTWFWGSVWFFNLQGVGILLQQGLISLGVGKGYGKRVKEVGNLLFVMAWLHSTCWGFINDMSKAGVWMFEPIPVSILRFVFGWRATEGDEGWWRWEGEYGVEWYWGERWWQSGIKI
ncbi:hypothetical protein QBC38DRAFT_383694 [Podospora fimiseda]|uniref:Wax synthase domain-containing protein n=1 Tax=Podospora fimiseda TaxID=252190 RepID=A0AAN7BW21_9PEZI|nr:hypothetical protein QBC38DRAFT_383694 [Podospora fimiseda]